MTHMLMGLAQGKLVVCLEVRDCHSFAHSPTAIDFFEGWLQSYFDLEISPGSHADPHWRGARPFATCSTYGCGN